MNCTPRLLPGVLKDIAGLAGRRAALDLALALGGRTIHVPRPGNVGPEHPIAMAMGLRRARVFAESYCGEQVYVPRARRALVVHLASSGRSNAEIIAMLGITRQTVSQYRTFS